MHLTKNATFAICHFWGDTEKGENLIQTMNRINSAFF